MKHQKSRMAAAAAAAILFCAAISKPACAQGAPEVSARSAILIDAASGRVLFEKNADEESLIASTTKIMTGLLICEAGDLEREVAVPEEAVGVEGSSLYLKAGERLTVRELLYGMLLHSGNDAALALAIVTAGSEEAFVRQMNERAASLGLAHTHFSNPHGLDSEGNYATARDLAKLCCAAMENESFCRAVSTKTAQAAGRSLTNHNKLLWRVDGADGIKTGYTKKAGRILAGSATQKGQRLICVTIAAPDDWRDQETLFSYGFSRFRLKTLVREGEAVGSVPVVGGRTQCISLIAGGALACPLAEGEEAELILHAPQFVYAPVVCGQAGWLEVKVDGKTCKTVPVFYAQAAEALPQRRGFWERLFGG